MKPSRRALGLGLLSTSLVVAVMAALPALAARPQRIARTIPLFPTLAGQQARLKGKAKLDIRPAQGREKITVEAESSSLATGTVLDVLVVNPTNSGDAVKIGELTLAPNPRRPSQVEDELEVKNYDGDTLPTGVSPAPGITRFLVTEHDNPANVLLTNVNPGGNPPGGGLTQIKRTIGLVPTTAGVSSRTKGKAEIEIRQDGRQKFKIEVESRQLDPGTELTVLFSTDTLSDLPAGTLLLQPSGSEVEGELEFDSQEGPALPAGANPVNKIKSVTVLLDGEVLLVGTF